MMQLTPDFIAAINARLDKGEVEYKLNPATDRPLSELVGEAREEIEDVVGWAYPLWLRLAQLEDWLKNLDTR